MFFSTFATCTPAGHGGTPHVNCFEVGSRNGCGKQHPSGTELQDFGCQATQGSEKHMEDQFSMSLHVYDFPSLQNGRRASNAYDHYEQEGNGYAGHSYEFPGHYHLATQYEIPVTSYEHSKSLATSRIYKNTLPSDVYVPTLVSVLTSWQLSLLCAMTYTVSSIGRKKEVCLH